MTERLQKDIEHYHPMGRLRRSERFRGFRETVTRPTLLDKVAAYYTGRFSRYPESVRVSFADGTSAVYELKVEQPAPVIASTRRRICRHEVGYRWKGART